MSSPLISTEISLDAEFNDDTPSRMKDLWVAVLLQACRDATNPPRKSEGEQYEAHREAKIWFRTAGPDFQDVCAAAGFDPDMIKAAYDDGTLQDTIRSYSNSFNRR